MTGPAAGLSPAAGPAFVSYPHFIRQVIHVDLLKTDVKKLYLHYLAASLGSAIVMSIYSFVDTIAVGQAEGPAGSAAMAVITPLYGVMVFLSLLCGIGGGVLMSKARGEGNAEKGNACFTAALVLMAALTALFWAAFLLFAQPIFTLFGADASMMPLVMRYARWIIWFCPLFLFSIFLAAFVRNDGNPGLAMRAVIIGGAFNIFGDWFFVFPLGMGIAGAAIATVSGSALQVIVLCTHFFSPKCGLRLVRPHRPLRAFRSILATGFGAGLVDLSTVVLACVANNQIMRYSGESALAVYGVVATCNSLFQAFFSGVGQAAQPIVSTNLGAGEDGRIRQTFRMALATSLGLGVFFTALGLLFPTQITRLFMDVTPEVLTIAPNILRTYFVTFLFMGITVLATYYLQSILRPALSMLIALLRGLILSTALLYLLPLFLDIQGVWLATPVSECIVALVSLVCFRQIHRAPLCPPDAA